RRRVPQRAPGCRAVAARPSDLRADLAPGAAVSDDAQADTKKSWRLKITTRKMPRLATSPQPELRLRLRTKLVVAMVFAALVPVVIVALLATRVILSSLEAGLREDADRQLTVGLNLVLRAVERLG